MLNKLTVVFTLVYFLIVVPNSMAAKRKKRPKNGIHISYSQSADVFELMDFVSGVQEGEASNQVYRFWKNKFNLDDEDQEFFKKYKKLRLNFLKAPREQNKDFFPATSSLKSDPLAEKFYLAKTLEEALEDSMKLVSPAEAKFLESFYLRFKDKIKIVLSQYSVYQPFAQILQKKLKKQRGSSYYRKVAKFFGHKFRFHLPVLLTWAPPGEGIQLRIHQGAVLVGVNPLYLKEKVDLDTFMPAVVEVLATHQEDGAKDLLEKQFSKDCSFKAKDDYRVRFAKPFYTAVGNIGRKSLKLRKKFDPVEINVSDSWSSVFLHLIYPHTNYFLNNKLTIQDGLMKRLAAHCNDLLGLTKKNNRKVLRQDGRP